MSFKTYYDRLGLSSDASQDDIKAAYRQLAQELHPDKLPGNISAKMEELAKKEFNELREAYLVLSNPNARTTYDRRLADRMLAEQRAAERKGQNSSASNGEGLSRPWKIPLMNAAVGAGCAIIVVSIVNAAAAINRKATVQATGAASAPASIRPDPASELDGADPASPTPASLPSAGVGTGGMALSETSTASVANEVEFTRGEITRFATALLELQPILNSTKAKLQSATTPIERKEIENEFDVQATRILLSHGMQPEEYQRIAARTETDAKIRLDVISATARLQQLGRYRSQ